MNVKTKLFYQGTHTQVDEQINDFLAVDDREYVDVKIISVENTIQTQTNIIVMLVYRPTLTDQSNE